MSIKNIVIIVSVVVAGTVLIKNFQVSKPLNQRSELIHSGNEMNNKSIDKVQTKIVPGTQILEQSQSGLEASGLVQRAEEEIEGSKVSLNVEEINTSPILNDDWSARVEIDTQDFIYEIAAEQSLNLRFDEVECTNSSCDFDITIADEYGSSSNKAVAKLMSALTRHEPLNNGSVRLKRLENLDGETKVVIRVEE